MSADKRVPGRSDEEARRIAERTKNDYGASRRRPVNILRHLDVVILPAGEVFAIAPNWDLSRDRMTLAHELGHAVLHHNVALFRMADAVGSTDLAKEAAYSSAEHQAKVFAAAFLSTTRMPPKWPTRTKSRLNLS